MRQLRPYQHDVVERAAARAAAGARAVLIQGPTGCGKGTIAAYLLARAAAKGKRAVFIAHRRRLVSQMVGNLAHFGVTNVGLVMRGEPRSPAPIQLVSRDTLYSRAARNEWMRPPPADLLVVDEAHNCGDKYETILSWYPEAVLVGMTATPVWPNGRGMGEVYQALECTVPASQLVAEGHLCPVRCYAPDGMVRGKAKKNALAADPIFWWRRHGAGRPTVLFAAKRTESRAARDAFLAAGITAEHVDALTEDQERDAVLDRLASGATQVVCSVGTLHEGTDVPPASCCILLRSARSCVVFYQSVGRIMRPHPGKADAVLIDHAGAVLRHGFPDEDVEWALDPADDVDSRNRKARKEGRKRAALVCPACLCVFSGLPECPSCGRKVAARRDRRALAGDDVLVEVPRERRLFARREDAARLWSRCRAVACHRGLKARAASVMFKREFGDWPERAGLPECPRGAGWESPASVVWPQFLRLGGGR